MEDKSNQFIQNNSPDGGFLQSSQWRHFQESVGHKTHHLKQDGFWANIIEHDLPVVGKYFYVPRGPVFEIADAKKGMAELTELARENKEGWIRIEPANEEALSEIKKNIAAKIVKAPHDTQPREIFVISLEKPEEEILAEMKSKTRYNIKLAEKKGVKIAKISNDQLQITDHLGEFLRLTKLMAERQGIVPHPDEYYRKMLQSLPADMLNLYMAELDGKTIAANLVIFYGRTATYLHGASDNEYRSAMAPYLLQWRQMADAKKLGCARYDLGGIKTNDPRTKNSWEGITRFKLGFSSVCRPIEFPGDYDIILSEPKYFAYNFLRKIRNLI